MKFYIIFSVFKRDNMMQAGFYIIITLKKLIFALILVIFNDYPIFDLIFFSILTMLMLYFLKKYLPYEKQIFNLRDFLSEFFTFVIYLVNYIFLH